VRLAILASHPVQYYGPFYRELAKRLDLHVFFSHKASPRDQALAGFDTAFEWDVDTTGGYAHDFLTNVARRPTVARFSGCDTPEIGGLLEKGGFDALLIMGWHLKSFLQGLFAAKRLRLPVMVRGDSQLATPRSKVKMALKEIAYPGFLRLFDAALYVGQRSRAYYEHYRYPADRLFFSPHCVDSAWFTARSTGNERTRLRSQLGIGPDAKVVLFAGKLVDFKRPLDVIEAAAVCAKMGTDVEVVVAGSGALGQAMTATAKRRGLRLHMLGFCNQSKMPSAYAVCDALVLPSNGAETWGLVANEALACGRPIIISNACGCAADLAADGHVGRAFPMGDVEALARAVTATLQTRPRPDEIAEISGRFSIAAASDGVIAAMSASRAARGWREAQP
jgi:glycosyltransferase involved in cell wall biosynthesis